MSSPPFLPSVNSPAVHGLVATSAGTGIYLWDFAAGQGRELFTWDGHEDRVQCVAWQWEGRLLATQARDKRLRLFDPRAAGDDKVSKYTSQGRGSVIFGGVSTRPGKKGGWEWGDL